MSEPALSTHSGLSSGCRIGRGFWRAVPFIAASFLAACTGFGKQAVRPNLTSWPEIRSDYRVEALRTSLREYSVTFAAEVEIAATAIERRASDATRQAQREALETRRDTRDAASLLSSGGHWRPRRRLDLCAPDGSALSRRVGEERLRPVPTGSTRGIWAARCADARDRRFGCCVAGGTG